MNIATERFLNIKDLLKAHIGRHGMSVDEASVRTGISKRRIQSHLDSAGSQPNADDMRSYLRELPETFAAEYLRPAQMRHCRVSMKAIPHQRILPAAGRVVMTYGDFMADGVLDHQERPVLRPLLFEAASTLYSVGVSLEN